MIDKLLKKKGRFLQYPHTQKSTKAKETEKKTVDVLVTRVHRGPAVTLIVECSQLKLTPFTIDLVASVQDRQLLR